jgi:hypothetical protein
MQINPNFLDFLTWVDRCLFIDDFEKELKEQGADWHTAMTLKQFVKKNENHSGIIFRLWCEFGVKDSECRQVLLTYLEERKKDYDKTKKG